MIPGTLAFRKLVVVGSSISLVACATLVGFFAGKTDHIKAPHARHAEADVDCGSCHETIFDSTDLSASNLPSEKKCLSCHKEEKEKGNCAFCHTNPEKPTTYAKRERSLVMNHAEHIERTKEDCAVCHKSLPEPLVTQVEAPSMDGCFSCHEHDKQWSDGACATCHTDLHKYPIKPILAFSHRGDFLRSHRGEARADDAACETCHDESFCSECHSKMDAKRIDFIIPERVDRAFIHRNDFLSRHPVEARADEALCQRCHGNDFCQTCHRENGLIPQTGVGVNPHPADFGQGTAHGPAARRDINSCASCHDQGAASNCVSCHKVGGVGGNPHPASFMVRHHREEIGRNAMCKTCHL